MDCFFERRFPASVDEAALASEAEGKATVDYKPGQYPDIRVLNLDIGTEGADPHSLYKTPLPEIAERAAAIYGSWTLGRLWYLGQVSHTLYQELLGTSTLTCL